VIGALAGFLLVAGLWTPVAFAYSGHPGIPAALAVLGLTLALIGPGEWSVDARLYGRKHIVPPRI
jgi:uncharacterized membrane protein YphA (DoxX/SURF4 family)